jgi:hypothetical protein
MKHFEFVSTEYILLDKFYLIILVVVFTDFFLVNWVQCNDNDVSHDYGTYLSHIVHLPSINQIKFEPYFSVGQCKDIEFILQ